MIETIFKAGFKGAAKRIEDADLPRIGHDIGVGEDEIHAFLDVEARGSGFDDEGRPAMLFEPHIFWRQLGPGPLRDEAQKLGLAYPKWRPGAYPKDSYPRLKQAWRIHPDAALRSASWGGMQIMGFNAEKAGFVNAAAMVAAFMEDEENHVAAGVQLLKAWKIDDDLRAHRWDVIERVWNGGGQNGAYAKKMAERFAWWQRKPDTPWAPGESPVVAENTSQESPPRAPASRTESIGGMIAVLLALAALVAGWLGFDLGGN